MRKQAIIDRDLHGSAFSLCLQEKMERDFCYIKRWSTKNLWWFKQQKMDGSQIIKDMIIIYMNRSKYPNRSTKAENSIPQIKPIQATLNM